MVRSLRNILAVICIILGLIGAFLPVMPTVPFLLAALGLASDSPRLKKFLDNNPVCKYYLENFRNKRPLTQYIKYFSLTGLWLSAVISFFLIGNVCLKIVIVIIAVTVTYLLAAQKSPRL